MADFFQWIANFFLQIWDFITDIFERMFLQIKYLALAAELAFNLVASMPSWLQTFGAITITVSIVYIILGRQTGGKKQ